MTPNKDTEAFMDAHLWNDQTEIVDALFPALEDVTAPLWRWYELKDSRPSHLEALKGCGAAVVEYLTHAWLLLPQTHKERATEMHRLGLAGYVL